MAGLVLLIRKHAVGRENALGDAPVSLKSAPLSQYLASQWDLIKHVKATLLLLLAADNFPSKEIASSSLIPSDTSVSCHIQFCL